MPATSTRKGKPSTRAAAADREDFAAGQAKDAANFQDEQAEALTGFMEDQTSATVSLHENHRDERKDLISDLAIEMFETYPDDGDGGRMAGPTVVETERTS